MSVTPAMPPLMIVLAHYFAHRRFVPLSPEMKTVASVGATLTMRS